MVLPETKENQRITVNVVRTDPDSHQFIVTYGDDGKLYRLPMLLYQKEAPYPTRFPASWKNPSTVASTSGKTMKR